MPPPRGAADERATLVKQAEEILEHLPESAGLIVTSSISVYAKRNQLVTEADNTLPKSERGQALRAYEQAFQRRPVVLLRLAGLFGEGRQPGRFLAGKTGVAGGASPVNMVHGDDVVAAIKRVLESMTDEQVSGTFNICADTHPTRQIFFERAAARANLTPPTFSAEPKPYAQVANQRFKDRFGFTYRYPDVLTAL
jgi:nucleoside-diphosphate-sugar epimerase